MKQNRYSHFYSTIYAYLCQEVYIKNAVIFLLLFTSFSLFFRAAKFDTTIKNPFLFIFSLYNFVIISHVSDINIIKDRKMVALYYFICFIASYLVGCINPAYIIAKIRGFDIRKKGSGNAGASNAVIVMGKKIGFLCAVFDVAKAAAVVIVFGKIFPTLTYAFPICATSCIAGHIFPFYMKFKGGKGLACLGGVILAHDPLLFAIMISAEAILLIITKYICFVPMTASVAFSIIYGIMNKDLIGALILGIAAAIILFKHVLNIKRIFRGTEAHITMLWNRQKEIDRIAGNTK